MFPYDEKSCSQRGLKDTERKPSAHHYLGVTLKVWKGRGETARMSLPSQLELTQHNLARDGYIESTCCCAQTRILVIETEILFPCHSKVYSALFYIVFKALNLFLSSLLVALFFTNGKASQ